jgi:ATP-dependent RNA helicase DeaD
VGIKFVQFFFGGKGSCIGGLSFVGVKKKGGWGRRDGGRGGWRGRRVEREDGKRGGRMAREEEGGEEREDGKRGGGRRRRENGRGRQEGRREERGERKEEYLSSFKFCFHLFQ